MSNNESEQRYLVAIGDTLTGWDNPEDKLKKAFAQNEFILYGQSIIKLAAGGEPRPHFEIFVRLQEEEQNLIPPGTFLPMLEYLNLGSELDRYVVRKLLTWYRVMPPEKWGIAHINLCADTLADQEFASFVAEEMKSRQVTGDMLCFEFPGSEAECPTGAPAVAESLRKAGCRISASAVSDETIPFGQVRTLGASFLKIGPQLIHKLTQSEVAAAEVKTAARACRSFDVQTIAQFVEDAPTLNLLRKLDIGYAQGYGISRPAPLYVAKTAEKS